MKISKYNEELANSLLHAFNSEGELKRLLRYDLEQDLDFIVAPGPLRTRIDDLTAWAEAEGKLGQLMLAAFERKPNNPKLKIVAAEMAREAVTEHENIAYEAAPLYNHDLENPNADQLRGKLESYESAGGMLEALVVRAPHLNSGQDAAIWSTRQMEARLRICLISRGGMPKGTGFLIGRDRIMTNSHVIDQAFPVTDYEVTFGYEGEKPLASLPNIRPAEELARSEAREFDFSILRLATPPIKNNGYFRVREHDFEIREPIVLLTHSNGDPLQFSFGVIFDANGFFHRIAYTANTQPGASGSPVFTENWDLVALHHHGQTGINNHGIPMKDIAAYLHSIGKSKLLESYVI